MNQSLALGVALCLLATTAAADRKETTFDYLYIVANEGASSGGHTAIRFSDDVYHFSAEEGLLVLRRERADEFLYSYALLSNRTVYATRVAVSQSTWSQLVRTGGLRHRAQEAQLEVRVALARDRELIEFLRGREEASQFESPSTLLSVPGLGYFEAAQPKREDRSATLEALRRAIQEEFGRDFLARRRRALVDGLRALDPEDAMRSSLESPASAYHHPLFAQSYSARWGDLRAGLAALDVLEGARLLDAAAHHAPEHDSFVLTREEVAALERYAIQLAGQLVDLSNSRRQDWGQTLLVGMARLQALDRSIATGRLVFLDSFPEEAPVLGSLPARRLGEHARLMLSENRKQFDASRGYFFARPDPAELAWGRLEERANRYFEILSAMADNRDLRVARGHLVPARSARYPHATSLAAASPPSTLDQKRARERERGYAQGLRQLHGYNLLSQNCVTAIFDTLNDSFDDSVQISQQQLGGHVGGSPQSLAFIPFVSNHYVNERYRVVERETLLSYRRARLREMGEREDPRWVALRESNTFTATSYRRHPGDSFFVFFTDGSIALRPIFGAVNLAAGVAEALAGLAVAPVDRGAMLTRGLRGTFVSLPELAFANIRKGSNDWIPSQHRRLARVAAP